MCSIYFLCLRFWYEQECFDLFHYDYFSRLSLRCVLNIVTVGDSLITSGSEFHYLGAAYVNALSPRVDFDFPDGYFNNALSFELRRL